MQNENSYPDFEISHLQTKKWPTPSADCFCQIIYVISGNGKYHDEEDKFDFTSGDTFINLPGQSTSLSMKDEGDFLVINFQNIYTSKKDILRGRRANAGTLYKPLEYLFHNYTFDLVTQQSSKKNMELLHMLFDELLKENGRKTKNEETIKGIVKKIVTAYFKEVQKKLLKSDDTGDRSYMINEVRDYIHQNIYDVYKVRVDYIAKHFDRAKDYLGFFFKSHTGYSMKDYMTLYKFELIKSRLMYSNKTILEIVHEFGFTDESHMNRIFKNLFGETAKSFKNNYLEKK